MLCIATYIMNLLLKYFVSFNIPIMIYLVYYCTQHRVGMCVSPKREGILQCLYFQFCVCGVYTIIGKTSRNEHSWVCLLLRYTYLQLGIGGYTLSCCTIEFHNLISALEVYTRLFLSFVIFVLKVLQLSL